MRCKKRTIIVSASFKFDGSRKEASTGVMVKVAINAPAKA